jgi:hypothetical protein
MVAVVVAAVDIRWEAIAALIPQSALAQPSSGSHIESKTEHSTNSDFRIECNA